MTTPVNVNFPVVTGDEHDIWSALELEYYSSNTKDKYNETVITLRTFDEDAIEVLGYSNNHVTIKFTGGWESSVFLEGLKFVLDAHNLVEKIDGK